MCWGQLVPSPAACYSSLVRPIWRVRIGKWTAFGPRNPPRNPASRHHLSFSVWRFEGSLAAVSAQPYHFEFIIRATHPPRGTRATTMRPDPSPDPNRDVRKILRSRSVGAPYTLAILIAGSVVFSCDAKQEGDPDKLIVFAASSVADALDEIAEVFTRRTAVRVFINQGASGSLCKQIQLAAAFDVFIPAAPGYLDQLERLGKIDASSRRPLTRNRLVVVAPGNEKQPWPDLRGLMTRSNGASIVIANPDHAPAGHYAREALCDAGVWEALEDRLIFADDVRMAARYVAEGTIRYGIVYATDAMAFKSKLTIVYNISESAHSPIVYEGATGHHGASGDSARSFLEYIRSPETAVIWRKHGFLSKPASLKPAGSQ